MNSCFIDCILKDKWKRDRESYRKHVTSKTDICLLIHKHHPKPCHFADICYTLWCMSFWKLQFYLHVVQKMYIYIYVYVCTYFKMLCYVYRYDFTFISLLNGERMLLFTSWPTGFNSGCCWTQWKSYVPKLYILSM